MSARRRNHYIPRFLLNRFASRAEGDKRWIWQLSRGDRPRQISTKDAAVSRDFYGGPQTGVENAFSAIETPLHNALVSLDRGDPPNSHSDVLRRLVWTLACRTAALRIQFEQTATDVMDALVDAATSEKLSKGVLSHFEANLDQLFLEALPPEHRAKGADLLQIPAARAAILQAAREHIGKQDLKPWLVGLSGFVQSRGAFRIAARDGQNTVLAKILESREIPAWFEPAVWERIDFDAHSLILGDCCVVAIGNDGRLGPLLGRSDDWQSVYVPIAHSSLLIAQRTASAGANINTNEANLGSAKCSIKHLYASTISGEVNNLLGSVASIPILDKEMLDEMRRDAWSAK